ncbi:uncharacterized protein Z518_04602 [Rhinocladiella mackenziei CBS 650.93]|uniref:Xylanolytic transcriptional activator regulatory domain-containing protein n=1 Tax=Rhinocladiella mackenziei CBS 650.93 TaxID=1442369 RepID=A0A0D2ITX7_9EURO|nr:uncharacterized protein Z518_04602 [Rhinocladiella mackenziei CBS 650.93]KIX06626.1 hypothetical protein Z518_04602 [Rhinocladiella mackenziei CBS 650.93]
MITRTGEESELFHDGYSKQLQREGFSATAPQDLAKRLDQADDKDLPSCPNNAFYGDFSLSRIVDEFKLLLPYEGPVQDIVASIQTTSVFEAEFDDEESIMPTDWGNLEQLLSGIDPRMFTDTDAISELTPYLRRLYLKYLSIRWLLDSGKVVRAWANFSNVVRDAQLMGLDRDESIENSAPNKDNTESRRRIWWLLVNLDAQLSFLLGRQPLISPTQIVPKPAVDISRREVKDLHYNIMDFSQYLLEVLGEVTSNQSKIEPDGLRSPLETYLGQVNSNQPTEEGSSRAKRSTLETYLSRLQRLQSKLPHLPRDGMTEVSLCIAEHQLEVQLFSMFLNCQLFRCTLPKPARPIIERHTSAPNLEAPGNLPRQSFKTYLSEAFQSSRRIIDIFDYIYSLDPFKSTSSWLRCFGVFCAAVILGIGRLGREVELEADSTRIERMLKIFQELSKRSPESRMSQMVAKTLDDILKGFKVLDDVLRSTTDFSVISAIGEASPKAVTGWQSTTTRSKPKDKVRTADSGSRSLLEYSSTSTYEEDIRAEKRRYSKIQSGHDNPWQENASTWQIAQDQCSFEQQRQQQQAPLPSASMSFNASEQLEYSNVGFLSTFPANPTEFFSVPWWVYPPMSHPSMYHIGWQGQDLSFAMMSADAAQDKFCLETSTGPVREPHQLDADNHDSQNIGLGNVVPSLHLGVSPYL